MVLILYIIVHAPSNLKYGPQILSSSSIFVND